MLVLTRKIGETIHLGDDIKLIIIQIAPGKVRIGIEAPQALKIFRGEIYEKILAANQADPDSITMEM